MWVKSGETSCKFQRSSPSRVTQDMLNSFTNECDSACEMSPTRQVHKVFSAQVFTGY